MAAPTTPNSRFIELHNLAYNEPGCNEAVITDPLTLELIGPQGSINTFDLQGKRFSSDGFIVVCANLAVFQYLYPGKCNYEHTDNPSVADNNGRVGLIALRRNGIYIDVFGNLEACDATDTRPNSCFDDGTALRQKAVTFGPKDNFSIYIEGGKLSWSQWTITRPGAAIRDVDPGEWNIEVVTSAPTTSPTIPPHGNGKGKGKGKGGRRVRK